MTNTEQEILKMFTDPKQWRPPGIRDVAAKTKHSTSTVHVVFHKHRKVIEKVINRD